MVIVVVHVVMLVCASLQAVGTFSSPSHLPRRCPLPIHSFLLASLQRVIVQGVEAHVLQSEVLPEDLGPAPSFIPVGVVGRARRCGLWAAFILVDLPQIIGFVAVEIALGKVS